MSKCSVWNRKKVLKCLKWSYGNKQNLTCSGSRQALMLKSRAVYDSSSSYVFHCNVKIDKSNRPAFLGQVFSMYDLFWTSIMVVFTHFDIPFLSGTKPNILMGGGHFFFFYFFFYFFFFYKVGIKVWILLCKFI
jgi:hypothetical protein